MTTTNGLKTKFTLRQSVRFFESPTSPPSKRGTGVVLAVPAGGECSLYALHRLVFDDGRMEGFSRQFVAGQLETIE